MGRPGGTHVGLLAILFAIGMPGLFLGCTSTAPSPDDQALRQAAIERWSRCVERRSERFVETLAAEDAGRRVERDCEGHRRDVVNAFPPHMERPLERVLDERAVRRSRTHLRRRIRDLPPDLLVKRLFGMPPSD